MDKVNGWPNKAALAFGHVAGLIDMVALPVWVGVLIQAYQYTPEHAGLTVTGFLLGVLAASVLLAPRFNRLPRKPIAIGGFAVAGAALAYLASQPVANDHFSLFLVLHAVAGLGVGCSLSLAHGAMGRTANPHRMFGIAHLALGIFAFFFLAIVPQMIQHKGVDLLFWTMAVIMLLASLVMAIGYPSLSTQAETSPNNSGTASTGRVPPAAWLTIGVVMCMNLNQSMMLSFIERIGATRGFSVEQVNMALVALGFVNMFPGGLAALLQKRISPITVGIVGLAGQAGLALTMSQSGSYLPYAVAASFFVSMAIFTHTFLFGLLSSLDTSGRAVAATPATIMMGSALGPAIGGAIVQNIGFPGLGWMAAVIASVGIVLLMNIGRLLRGRNSGLVGAAV